MWSVSVMYLLMIPVVLLLVLPLVGFLSYTVYLFYLHRKYAHIPGPHLESFYFGNLNQLRNAYRSGRFHQYLFKDWAEEHGPLIKMFVLHKCFLIPTSETFLKEILTKSKYPKCPSRYKDFYNLFGARFLGEGLVSNTDHSSWYQRRRQIDPAFHRRSLLNMISKFNNIGDQWIVELQKFAESGREFSMSTVLTHVTLDIIAKVGFDLDLNTLQKNKSFPDAISKVLEGLNMQRKDPLIKWRWGSESCRFRQEVAAACQYLRDQGRHHILQRQEDTERGKPTPEDVLTYLIKAREKIPSLDTEDLLDDWITLFIAGQETTANTLGFMFLHLGRRPDIVQRLRDEVDEVLGDHDQLTLHHVPRLQYLSQVWRETLRFYPVAPGTSRTTVRDELIDGFKVPAHSEIIVPFFTVHHMDQHFPDPEEFRPERFAPGQERPLFAYLPFSMGGRKCAGRQFAQIEICVLICKFLKHFDFKLDPHQSFELQETTTLRPKDGCMMSLTTRKR